MFCFEWNEKEEREALLEAGETRGKLEILKNIMAKNNWPAERALEFMGIAKSQYILLSKHEVLITLLRQHHA